MLAVDPDVRAVVSSGYSNDDVIANYRACGFTDVITKPYIRVLNCVPSSSDSSRDKQALQLHEKRGDVPQSPAAIDAASGKATCSCSG